MAGSGRRYALEFKARMVELVRAGQSPDRLAKEFEPSATAIRRWVEQADRGEGLRKDGLTTAERKEMRELKRELCSAKLERDILAKATAWFAIVGRWFFVQVLEERGTPGVVARGVPDSRLPPGGRGPRAAGSIEGRTGPVQPVQDSLAKG